ncbi:MAG: hypothetical protein CV080_10635 [Candidatus Kuenenia stuttgartiensis]|jgi:hypothetical protein|nr:MAG: hypothetical protein CV080_10635 [Candidatus Kuenenia stuttgartiensis]
MKVYFQISWVAWFHSFFHAKPELLKQLRSQAGAWEREENRGDNEKFCIFHAFILSQNCILTMTGFQILSGVFLSFFR